MNKNKGITLIALVITIIVLLILAGVTIAMLMGDNGIITQAQEAKISTELSGYKEELEIYKISKLTENQEFLEGSLTAGKTNLSYNTQKAGETGNIKTVITSISDEYMEKLEIIKGKLLINTKDKDEVKIAQSLGIEVNPYDITEEGELLSSNGNLLLMDENGTLTIPDSVTKIGEGAFANLNGLKTIIIPGSVKEIGTNAFSYNTTLETVIMQEGVETIGRTAFQYCINLTNVQMPESLLNIEYASFYECIKLEKIEIPSQIRKISTMTFSRCANLVDVKFRGNIIETIEKEAFYDCKISSITITEKVKNIDTVAFARCSQLENICIDSNNNNFRYQDGILMTFNKQNIIFVSTKYYANSTEFKIPENVVDFNTDIYNLQITKLIIPSSVTKINPRHLPASITEVEISENNTTYKTTEKCIYKKDNSELTYCFSKDSSIILSTPAKTTTAFAFSGASNAKEITLAEGMEYIDTTSFSGCGRLEKLNLSKSIKKIHGAFLRPYKNIKVSIDIDNPNFVIENDVIYSKNKETLISVCKEINGVYNIDSQVKEIGAYAFYSQNKMTNVNFNNSQIEKLQGGIFEYCFALTKVDIPKSVREIGANIFGGCNNLNEININKPANSILGAPWGAPKGMKVVNWRG